MQTAAVPVPVAAAAPRPKKGEQTRAAIVDAALAIASRDGLEGLTIGVLAEQMRMSKSGVFAHFGSREELQLAVLAEYARRFVDEILRPATRAERGLPRLQRMLDNWLRLLAREIAQGCLMISGAFEYDDRTGPLHDAMVDTITGWKRELKRAIESAKAEGHLRREVDSNQLIFEIYGLMLALHQDARLLRSPDSIKRARAGLARLLADASVPPTESGKPAASRRASHGARPAPRRRSTT
jgi:AcrR family transcriptional regulator